MIVALYKPYLPSFGTPGQVAVSCSVKANQEVLELEIMQYFMTEAENYYSHYLFHIWLSQSAAPHHVRQLWGSGVH